jgi:trans-aconitate 2-methyltransferase
MAWNPDTYNLFKQQRYEPFYDLLNLLEPVVGKRCIDLGCGTGELTRFIADRLPGTSWLGIDSSPEMLEKAVSFSDDRVNFICRSIGEQLRDESAWDLIFSNAALQWIGDHETLFPQIIARLSPGAQLLIQVPSNHDHFTHRALQELAGREPYRTILKGWMHHLTVLPISSYAGLLYANGCEEITVLEKVYPHVLDDADALYKWVSGTALIRYTENLPDEWAAHFRDDYLKLLREVFTQKPVFYPFKRILMKAKLRIRE